jgi:hypothetical protein
VAKPIVWTAQARADVRSVERETALRILKTLARYAEKGEGDTKVLKGIDPPLMRLRAQNHRIFSATRATCSRFPECWIVKRRTNSWRTVLPLGRLSFTRAAEKTKASALR